jgi:hypothetical protein
VGGRALVLEVLELVPMKMSIQTAIVSWAIQNSASFLDAVG